VKFKFEMEFVTVSGCQTVSLGYGVSWVPRIHYVVSWVPRIHYVGDQNQYFAINLKVRQLQQLCQNAV
jgi:hypothetical protein